MRYPKMNKQPKRVVNIPLLQGGVNLRDALNMCADNQLTDSVNMWFKDGMLQTRPGIEKKYDWWGAATPDDATIEWSECENEQHLHNDVFKVMDGKTYTLITFLSRFKDYKINDNDEKRYYSRLDFFWVTDDGEFAKVSPLCLDSEIKSYVIVANSKNIYVFLNTTYGGKIYEFKDDSFWSEIADEQIYAPLIMTHCKTVHMMRPSAETLIEAGGVMVEGYNLLGNRYRMKYSTINKNILSQTSDLDLTKRHSMRYSILHMPPDGSTVTAKLTDKNGVTHTHIATIGNNHIGIEEKDPGDGYILHVSAPVKSISFLDANTREVAYVTENDTYLEDNLEIIAPCPNDEANLKKIFNMTQSIWFGGTVNGLAGGTRLFLCGNKDNEKSLVCWSALDNPLYFPENCYFMLAIPEVL